MARWLIDDSVMEDGHTFASFILPFLLPACTPRKEVANRPGLEPAV